jgi:hypothetical protein
LHILKILETGNHQDVNLREIKARISIFPEILQPISIESSCCKGERLVIEHVYELAEKSKRELYQPTILGALCARDFSKHETSEILDLIAFILELCPKQIMCSQLIWGYTPFRTACRNETCGPEILELLMQAHQRHNRRPNSNDTLSSLIHLQDNDGLTPIDHLVRLIQSNPYCNVHKRLRVLMNGRSFHETYPAKSNPLLHLFSTGCSAGRTTPLVMPDTTLHVSEHEYRLQQILQVTRTLLQYCPDLVTINSPVTECSPLHVAIRNYGNFASLIEELILVAGSDMKHKNIFMDLPAHVACSAGVPMDILRLILERTLLSDGSSLPFSVLWSRNAAGFTPVDLEWIRHIEVGHGFFSNRPFYPLDTRGVRGVQGSLYDNLLRQAVNQVVVTQNVTENKQIHFYLNDGDSMGLLIHRIFLLIHAAFGGSFFRTSFDLEFNILHKASALCSPYGPTLPSPILELILKLYPEQANKQDDEGKLPLHHAVQQQSQSNTCTEKTKQEWRMWLKTLLAHSGPAACNIVDRQGRLPLHYALDSSSGTVHREDDFAEVQRERMETVCDLIESSPASVDCFDPVTKLYPFQQAAANSSLSLDCVYMLLRQAPNLHGWCYRQRISKAKLS